MSFLPRNAGRLVSFHRRGVCGKDFASTQGRRVYFITTAASISWGIAGRRFDSPTKSWTVPAGLGLLFVAVQVALLFIESKEEEELSLSRARRLANERHLIAEREKLSKRIQDEIDSGNPELVEKWDAIRRDRYGK